jgi:hypothetical protein
VLESRQVELEVIGARSLVWIGGELFDVAAGWRHLPLDGSAPSSRCNGYGASFDAAVTSPSEDVVALVASVGTKGLLLGRDARILREIDRSDYRAAAYRYPVALLTLPDGDTGIVHCPEQYNRLEIENATTGQRLSASDAREPKDVFHSRLAVSPSGRYLLSAGWVWHPWGCLFVYDLHQALRHPQLLDGFGDVFDLRGLIQAEVSGACFIGDDVLISTSDEPNEPETPDDLAPNMLVRWSSTDRRFAWRRQLDHCAGDLLPVDGGVLAVNGHPRLFDATTGDLVHAWPDLPTGLADGSITWEKTFTGPARIAIDKTGPRFAYTDGQRVVIVTWETST